MINYTGTFKVIQQIVDWINNGGGGSMPMPPEYDPDLEDPTVGYFQGQYVIYNGSFYKCKVFIYAHEGYPAGPFDSTKWDEVTDLFNEFFQLKPGIITDLKSQNEVYNDIYGNTISANSYNAHAEGLRTTASNTSHAEGMDTVTTGSYCHAEGGSTNAGGTNQSSGCHAEGYGSIASGSYSHAEGQYTKASGYRSHAEGYNTQATSDSAHAEGYYTNAVGDYSHAEGYNTVASNSYAHAEGYYTEAVQYESHAEGNYSKARGTASHAEGSYSIASGTYSHAEGGNTCTASGYCAHAEGQGSIASGSGSHSEGYQTQAVGNNSHAEGYDTRANGDYSHAGGYSTEAKNSYETAIGRYNLSLDSAVDSNYYLFSVGNGAYGARSNAFAVRLDGTCEAGGQKIIALDPPSTDGTYTLQCTVTNGVATYAWV